MIDDALHAEAVQQLQNEIKRLKRLVFQSIPMKRGAIARLFSKQKGHGHGGATDYEVWLRTLEWPDLRSLIELHTGVIDAFRYRRRFIQNEAERRSLHSSYGEHSPEDLVEISRGLK